MFCFTQAFLLPSSLQGCCLGHTGCHWASVTRPVFFLELSNIVLLFIVIFMAPPPWGLHRSQISSPKYFPLLGKNSNCSSCEHPRSPCFVYGDPGLPPCSSVWLHRGRLQDKLVFYSVCQLSLEPTPGLLFSCSSINETQLLRGMVWSQTAQAGKRGSSSQPVRPGPHTGGYSVSSLGQRERHYNTTSRSEPRT